MSIEKMSEGENRNARKQRKEWKRFHVFMYPENTAYLFNFLLLLKKSVTMRRQMYHE